MQTTMKNSVLLGASLFSMAGLTQAAELTANVGVTSNYVFRGATQTDDGPAVQGGIDYIHDSGVYAGAWASNVDFPGQGDGFEVDLYVGYNFKLNEAVTFDVGYITYQYTDSAIADADEIFFGASFKDFSATYYVGDKDVAGDGDYSYIDLKFSYALPQEFVLHLHYGNLDDEGGRPDAEDASVGVSKNIMDFDIGLTITTIDYDGPTPDEEEIFITANKAFQIM